MGKLVLMAVAAALPLAAIAQTAAVPVAAGKPQLAAQAIRAQLTPRRYTTLAAELGAKVSRITVREGEWFRAGQTLVTFDCALQQAQLQRAEATVTSTEQTLSANRRLAELNSVGKLELDNAVAEVAKARADLALIHATLTKCRIDAPFAGRVAEQKTREQQYAQPGQPLLDIIDDSALELDFIVPSQWLAWLRGNHAFQVRIDETGKTYPARVTRLGARVDPVSQSVRVAGVIDGRFSDLLAGMSGQVLMAPPTGR